VTQKLSGSQNGKKIKVNIENEIIIITLVVHNLNCLSNWLLKMLHINEFPQLYFH
jgi:hypothetical protein